jgi:cyclohexa-1,5-dienecarbonyl-CoA hydratase
MTAAATTPSIRVERHEQGAVVALRLARPKANVLDAAMLAALDAAAAQAAAEPHVKALLLCAEGPHFSFGASVEEHLPGREAGMLAAIDGLLGRLLALRLPILAAVRGQCLGGGLELASVAQRIVAAPDARLAQPEIVLGVFAPAASVLLPARLGQARADDLLLSGRGVGADEALRMGLVDDVAADPEAAALAWVRAHLLPKSAASLRFAVGAARGALAERFAREIAGQERIYLSQLMSTADALEGLRAFVEKRPPVWKQR